MILQTVLVFELDRTRGVRFNLKIELHIGYNQIEFIICSLIQKLNYIKKIIGRIC